jgi:pimeloyl-ACP methyl ester carboxylesterase
MRCGEQRRRGDCARVCKEDRFAVLDDLGINDAVLIASVGAFATAALFAATYPYRTTALVALGGYADPARVVGFNTEEFFAEIVATWGTGEMQHAINPDMPWNEEIRVGWARHDRLAVSPRTVELLLPLTSEFDVRAVLPKIRVLVSSTLRDLVIGSGLEFDERGTHELKGVPGQWNVYAVA